MRILSVGNCELSAFLGSGKTRLRWSEGLRALGHQVDVLQPSDFVLWPNAQKAMRFRLAAGALLVIRRRIRRKRYDLVELFGGELGWITRFLSQRRDRPIIVAHSDGLELLAYHGGKLPNGALPPFWNPRKLNYELNHWLDYDAFRFADRFVSASREEFDFVVRSQLFQPEHVRTIPLGVDREFIGRPFRPGDKNRIAFTGTWTTRKNPGVIVRVVSAVLAKNPSLVFDIFGAPGHEQEIHAAFPPELRSRVLVHPKLPVNALSERIAKCSIFFFPSRYEGFGMALAEAMACGCAAVTTPTGFGANLRDGVEAVVRPCEDSPGMEQAILDLIGDDARREAMARAGWSLVQTLRWEDQVQLLEQTYGKWLNEWQTGVK